MSNTLYRSQSRASFGTMITSFNNVDVCFVCQHDDVVCAPSTNHWIDCGYDDYANCYQDQTLRSCPLIMSRGGKRKDGNCVK